MFKIQTLYQISKKSICNLKIEEIDHFSFLGLIIDRNMKWHTHLQKVENKIWYANGILHKFKYRLSLCVIHTFSLRSEL